MEFTDFLDRAQILTQTLLKVNVIATKIIRRHSKLVDRKEISISQMAMDLFPLK
jgi:hypothetical protein